MKHKSRLILLIMLLLSLLTTKAALGNEYFLFDAEKNKINFMGENDLVFSEKIDMAKVPDLMMRTDDPQKYLAIYGPETSKESQESKDLLSGLVRLIGGKKEEKEDRAGQLILFNISNGRTEDLVDLGYAPFNWVYTEDHKHLFITYRTTTKKDASYELLHYNISEMTAEKLPLSAEVKNVNSITLSLDDQNLYLLLDNQRRVIDISETGLLGKKQEVLGTPQMITVSYSPLQVKANLPVESAPLSLRMLDDEKAVLICQDWSFILRSTNQGYNLGKGQIKLMDLKNNSVLEEKEIPSGTSLYYQWYNDEKVMILYYKEADVFLSTKYKFIKVTSSGMKLNEIGQKPVDFDYLTDRDHLYILTAKDLKVLDYPQAKIREYNTGSNIYKNFAYYFYRLPESDLAAISSYEDGRVKLFDLNTNLVLDKTLSGRPWGKVKYLCRRILSKPMDAETQVATTQANSQFYIANRKSGDITVYDRNFDKLSYIVPPEPPLGIFQVKQPSLQTLVVTGKMIYKINEKNLSLNTIYEFKKKTQDMWLFEEEKRTIILTPWEFVVLDGQNLQVQDKYEFFVDSAAQYTKLKPGEQRFYFIRTL